MDIEELRNFCLSLKATEETFPFDKTTLVFKVMGKMFLLVDIDSKPLSINIKCDPDYAIELREKYATVQPGYHMNKQHWNTVTDDGLVNEKELKKWIVDSYNLIIKSLPKKVQQEFNAL